MEKKQLIEKAFEAAENAYAPFSNYHVGCALQCKDGTIFLGANIENCSFGATNCAERSAIFAAYSNGYRKNDFIDMACVSQGHGKIGLSCGICRQVMADLLPADLPVYFANYDGEIVKTVAEMLPEPFTSEDFA